MYDSKGRMKDTCSLTSSMGMIYKNYGSDPLERIMVVMCCFLACSQFFLVRKDHMALALEEALKILVW